MESKGDVYRKTLLRNDEWLNFKGRWGENKGLAPSPEGPVFRSSNSPDAYFWIEPLYWQSEW